MARKFFTLNPEAYYGRQLSTGGKNEIFWTLIGCMFLNYTARKLYGGQKQDDEKHKMYVKHSVWF